MELVPLFLAWREIAACEIKQPESSLFYYFLVVFFKEIMDPRYSRATLFCVDLNLQIIVYFVPFACNLTTCELGPK